MTASEVRQMCSEKGIVVTPSGKAWRLQGNGVDVTIARLEEIGPSDLLPVYASLSKASKPKGLHQ
jgi:hypothetical protein